MQFCSHVYFGRKAEKNRERILNKLKQGSLQPEVYVITFPLSDHYLYEIFPSVELLLPEFRKEERTVVGIAVTYWEALEVACRIVDDRQKQGEL